jgi:hypothetical protein
MQPLQVYVHARVHVPGTCPCPCPCPCHVFVDVSVHVNLNSDAMNIYVRYGNFIVNSQGSYDVARKLKGPLSRERIGKISKKIRCLSLQDLSNDTTFSKVHLAGQSLYQLDGQEKNLSLYGKFEDISSNVHNLLKY